MDAPMPAIHQFVAGFAHGDAISNETLVIQQVFRSWGCSSAIFADPRQVLPELRSRVLDVHGAVDQLEPDAVLLLHLSIGAAVNEVFRDLPHRRKAILYHNVTPPHFFRAINARTTRNLELGRAQVARLAGSAEINLADSRFNASELESMGYPPVRVFPIAMDFDQLRITPDPQTLSRLRDGKRNILFVGRCAPNKRIEDLLFAFYAYQKHVEPDSRLIHVGSWAGTERYHAILQAMARELRVSNVLFAGSVPQSHLNACYAASDIFLCMSEHEGFCIPIIEAMAAGVPVLAHAAGAVPETMAGAGILFPHKNFHAIAEMMGSLTRDARLRAAIQARQRNRVRQLEQRDVSRELRELLAPLLDAPAHPKGTDT
jgi:glycosyltransferase involved in cell wall biosynthesis